MFHLSTASISKVPHEYRLASAALAIVSMSQGERREEKNQKLILPAELVHLKKEFLKVSLDNFFLHLIGHS